MLVEFFNLNDDKRCDPEIHPVRLSRDGEKQTPAYCLPWVEASNRVIQLKSNFDYLIRKDSEGIQAFIEQDGELKSGHDMYLQVPPGMAYFPIGPKEEKDRMIKSASTPAFSSPWQKETGHSVTLKLGIGWWTSPGWGLFICGPIHRSSEFRIEEGYVRTDLWHRDIPIVVQPLRAELRIPKYSVLASAILVPADELSLRPAEPAENRVKELVDQCSVKRMSQHIYKAMVRGTRPKK